MIGILKYLTVRQLAESQDHIIMSTSDFSEAQTKTHDRGYQQGRAEAIEEYTEKILADLIPMRDKKFDIAKGTAMPERYTHLKVMDTLDMIIEMVKIREEQLKEKNNGERMQ